MWFLDSTNSPALMAELSWHGRRVNFQIARVGEGWRDLVADCHRSIVASFPDYELLDVKQKYGVLAFQANPRPWVRDRTCWTDNEAAALGAIKEDARTRSESRCEWCGADAQLRDSRSVWLTLCSPCDARFPDPPDRAGHIQPDET
ncbi:MAG TPA: hypothetical protein DEQ43_04745 [Nocardioides bacterium]|nr:hypothetical protein [Nocardioides sp.]